LDRPRFAIQTFRRLQQPQGLGATTLGMGGLGLLQEHERSRTILSLLFCPAPLQIFQEIPHSIPGLGGLGVNRSA
jgi:hypothetical protein